MKLTAQEARAFNEALRAYDRQSQRYIDQMILGEESKSNSGRAYATDTVTFKQVTRGQAVTYRDIYEAPFIFDYKGVILQQQSSSAPIFTEKNESVIGRY